MQAALYIQLARAFDAYQNCTSQQNTEWAERWQDRITELCENHLPHGSGFDNGTMLDLDASKENRLVLVTSYHHMTEYGFYDGWTDHTVVVTPDLSLGYDLRVTGRNVRDIKDYIGDTFAICLDEIVD